MGHEQARWDSALLDVSRLTALRWRPKVRLKDGLQETYAWYQQHVPTDARL